MGLASALSERSPASSKVGRSPPVVDMDSRRRLTEPLDFLVMEDLNVLSGMMMVRRSASSSMVGRSSLLPSSWK